MLVVVSQCSPIDNRRTNKAIVRNYIQMLENKENTGRLELYFADPVMFNGNELPRQSLMELAQKMFYQYEDLRATIETQIAEGDTVATRIIFEGTKLQSISGAPTAGVKVRILAIAIDRFKGDKVVEMWHTTENLDIQ